MKCNFDTVLTDHKNEPVKIGMNPESLMAALNTAMSILPETSKKLLEDSVKKHTGREVCLGEVCADALVGPAKPNEVRPVGENIKRLELAIRLAKGGQIEITPDERELIKKSTEEYYTSPVIPGRVYMLLEKE